MTTFRPPFTLFVQTAALLMAALLVAQLVAAAVILGTPPPRPDVTPLSQIAAQLERPRQRLPDGIAITRSAKPPPAPATLVEDPDLTAALAARLKASPSDVRLHFEADQDARAMRVKSHDPLFFGAVQASRFDGSRWITSAIAPAQALTPWQQRVALMLTLQFLILLPLAWLFATRLTRPIKGFAEAADRLGRAQTVGAVPEVGPRELRLAARAMNRMQQRIESHVRERTAMIGAIAHDLRTPLARIAFRIEEADGELRDNVQSDIASMERMIADTIGFVRGGQRAFRREVIDLAGIARRVASSACGDSTRVTIRIEPEPLPVLGDDLALERMIANLLGNALAYGSTATVEAGHITDRPYVRVCDDGPGIPPNEMERMFEPFSRGEPSRNRESGGVGLGLSIARTIALAHEAEIKLTNRSAGGLCAEVVFSRAIQTRENGPLEQASFEPAQNGRARHDERLWDIAPCEARRNRNA